MERNEINSPITIACAGCVGYAYVPVQELKTVYEPADGLCRGTIFPELDLTICEYGYVCKDRGGEQ